MFTDLNVEHAQLVLFLFHSLNLMQKKSVLLVTGSGAVRCSEAVKMPMKDSQLLHLSRLLLLLEYMMKHLYDAHPVLLEQVRHLLSHISVIAYLCVTFELHLIIPQLSLLYIAIYINN